MRQTDDQSIRSHPLLTFWSLCSEILPLQLSVEASGGLKAEENNFGSDGEDSPVIIQWTPFLCVCLVLWKLVLCPELSPGSMALPSRVATLQGFLTWKSPCTH